MEGIENMSPISTVPDLPKQMPLKGGPYDGHNAERDNEILGVAFFPTTLTVTGKKGSAVYDVKADPKTGKFAEFSHMG